MTGVASSRSGSHPPRRGVTGVVLLPLLTSALLLAPGAFAEAVTTMSAALPVPQYGASVVWDGTHAYLFGGVGSTVLGQIVRYDPTSNLVTTMSATLPTGRYYGSAVWDGNHAYIFGGADGSNPLGDIVRYDPRTDTVSLMAAAIPNGRYMSSAIWDGNNAYIFGGCARNVCPSDAIVRYNPATDTLTTMTATLPAGRFETSAIWDGTNAYIFGGPSDSTALSQIVRFDPATDTVAIVDAAFPTARDGTSAVWDGRHAYIFGGYHHKNLDEILRFDPRTNTVTTVAATLPTPRGDTSAVWAGSHAYIFGGHATAGDLDQIVRFTTDSTPPVITPTVAGTFGLGDWYRSDVTIEWTMMDPDSEISSSSGCTTSAVIADTTGQAFTCSVTSAGGTTSRSVTVSRDVTPPSFAPVPDHARLATKFGGAAVSLALPAASDATSGIAAIACAPASGALFPIGKTQVNCDASDVAGNVASTSFNVTVIPGPLTRLALTPPRPDINVGRPLQVDASGFDEYENPIAVSDLSWSTTSGDVSTEGVWTPSMPGFATVSAARDGITAPALVEGVTRLDVSVTIDPDPRVTSATGRVRVLYVDGAPVALADVAVDFARTGLPAPPPLPGSRVEGSTDAAGELEFSVPIAWRAPGDHTATARAVESMNIGTGSTSYTARL